LLFNRDPLGKADASASIRQLKKHIDKESLIFIARLSQSEEIRLQGISLYLKEMHAKYHLRQKAAYWILGAVMSQLVILNLMVLKWDIIVWHCFTLSFSKQDPLTLRVFILGVFAQVCFGALIVLKNLFPPETSAIENLLKMSGEISNLSGSSLLKDEEQLKPSEEAINKLFESK
jgi:hypothetical protein